MKFGYARISRSESQDVDMQLRALEKEGCERIFQDTGSGKNMSRSELKRLLDCVRPHDEIIVWRLDRLTRSLIDLVTLTDTLGQKGVALRSITEPIYNTNGPTGKAVLQIMAVMAEFERNVIVERTQAGLRAARERGQRLGRPSALTRDQVAYMNQEVDAGRLSLVQAATLFGVSRSTVQRARRDSQRKTDH
ncbi:resolvase [Komagataeibacter oboediens]|uniref:Resolvase n=1 Tax=Komagataeibacter oboediens TaxID=65958 RepID=A0A318QJW0_9PROT|nr:recombinase family protein [Komagataeibacter oboediens]PYD79756.1 resolvase [Komagataeibacter oboediens]